MMALPKCPLGFEWIAIDKTEEFPVYDTITGCPTGASIGYLFLGVNPEGQPWRYAVENPRAVHDWSAVAEYVEKAKADGSLRVCTMDEWLGDRRGVRLPIVADNPRTFNPDGGVM